jgi:CRISPR system Cascade subunit CasE
MYLSQLIFDYRNAEARTVLANAYRMHQMLSQGYPYPRDGRNSAILFRVEQRGNSIPVVLVQTAQQPDWDLLPAGVLQRFAGPKDLGTLQIGNGNHLRFRLRANPTKRLRTPSAISAGAQDQHGRLERRIGLGKEIDQAAWLERKGEAHGFYVQAMRIVPEGELRIRKQGGAPGMTFLSVLFDGVLEVRERTRFLEALRSGIGSGKAFGFGLLSVARA